MPPPFAPRGEASRAALATCATIRREVAFERAINSTMKPIYGNGVRVGTEPVVNDRLLMFLLRHYDKHGSRSPDQSLLDSFGRLVEADDPMPEQTWPDFPPETPEPSELNVDLSSSGN